MPDHWVRFRHSVRSASSKVLDGFATKTSSFQSSVALSVAFTHHTEQAI